MAERSTRNKIRWQFFKVVQKLEEIQGHLKFADDLAAGNSPEINDHLPALVAAVEEVKKVFIDFRDSI